MKGTHKIEIVLDNVALERLERQCAVAKAHDERMIYELVPDGLDVVPAEEVLYKVATMHHQPRYPSNER